MSRNNNFFLLFENVKSIIAETQSYVVRNINQAMILAYFQIGKIIIEDEQQGNRRAEYAKETIARLSDELNKEFGKGYSISNLEYMRSFYNIYQLRISQSVIGKFIPCSLVKADKFQSRSSESTRLTAILKFH